jgi:predicted outer membrane protein
MDESDVEAAKLALWRSANEGTQRFAESVMNAYISMNDDLLSVARSQDIHTIESSFCEGLKGERESVKRRLATLYGSGFDREYLDAQRRGYEHELDLLDTTLIPMARNSELKAALEARRSSVFQHIRMAEQLRGG